MNPLWWWRWWAGGDPDREAQLQEAQARIDEQRERADGLASQLDAAATEVADLRMRLEDAENEAQRLRARVAELEREPAGGSTGAATPPDSTEAATPPDSTEAATPPDSTGAAAPPDVTEAASVLGRRIKLDDLTAIEGIGPKIAELLGDAGYATWQRLSEADPADLRRVLDDAGPRYRVHDPANWPPQAGLLAHGRWQEFKDQVGRTSKRRAD